MLSDYLVRTSLLFWIWVVHLDFPFVLLIRLIGQLQLRFYEENPCIISIVLILLSA